MPPRHTLEQPVFIVGCGRSGTTVLGRLLAQHSQIAFLNGARQIWLHEPRTDVWSLQARERGGRLVLTANDVFEGAGERIVRDFLIEMRTQCAQRLVEKLPINSFRIDFISRIFPDAKFVHLVRNGLEVARSIGRVAERALWFGDDDYKWELLAAYARTHNAGALLQLCKDNDLRGLLEWRLTVTAAQNSLRTLPSQRSLEIRYEQLINNPLATCEALEKFVGIPPNAAMRTFAQQQIARQSAPIDATSLSSSQRLIGGELLARLGYLNA